MNVKQSVFGCLGCLSLVACGSSGTAPSHSSSSRPTAPDEAPSISSADFSPPPVPEGYTRVVAPVIEAIPPGGDELRCQYVLAGFDRDMDVLDVRGYQSKGGHHSVAYAVKNDVALGISRECNTEDNTTIGSFLGGVGGEAGGVAKLPDGVVFRFAKGSKIMLNSHFLNLSEDTVDGQSVLDIKFDEVDTSRKVASMFVNLTVNFTVAPQATTTAEATCTLKNDMQFLSFTNHMHNDGASAESRVLRAGSTTSDLVHLDPTWTSDMQFNPVFTDWTVAAPFAMKQGDVLTTHCEWQNATTKAYTFPDEMCVGIGFFLSDTSTSPTCINGNWLE